MYSAFAAWGTLNSRRAASPLVRLVEGKERWKGKRGGRPLTTPECSASKLRWNRAKSYCHLENKVISAFASPEAIQIVVFSYLSPD
ncbi:uncharacterized protein TNCV_5095511 [Trichonephila clavipes]|nr:uncharacterized protein TNCV_5095511 [Trichonephila clavipes]